MKQLLSILAVFILFQAHAQEKQKFNLGFEIQSDEKELSDGWIKWGRYDLSIDALNFSGKRSGKITSDNSGSAFGSIAYKIPAKYKGSSIRLEGYMKTKDVKNGFAGLLLRIDGKSGSLEFDNMQNKKISGTNDWKKYNITLNYPKEAEKIFIAGILVGKGEAWFDDFTLYIDGKDVQTLTEVERELSKVELDKEFDNGSSVEFPELSSNDIDNLELLGKVWGFLKYHHPEIAKENYNWDYELFRFLPKYLQVKKDKEIANLIIEWIDSFGKVEQCSECLPTEKDAFLKPDLKWIDNQNKALRKKLKFIYNNRSQGKHYYIGMNSNTGNPIFKNENTYEKMSYPDQGYRLLTVYRYWNMIHYFFPYKHLMDKDWNSIMKKYIPIFLNAKNELEYELAAVQIIGDVQDTHANLWGGGDKMNKWKGENHAPIHVRFIEDKLVVTDYYNPELKKEVGLKIGDVITHIEGNSIEQILKENSKYYPASNIPTQLRDISADLLRSNSTEIKIQYYSADTKEQTTMLKLYPRSELNIFRWYKPNKNGSYKMLDNNIGYVTLQSITDEDIPKIKEEFKNTKGIIIDIRNYPSTFITYKLGSYFVSISTPFAKITKGSIDNPGEFTFSKNLDIPSRGKTYQGKLIVLVNELSQSQAEFTAMTFKAGNNTTIIGSTTAGADGDVSRISLPGGLGTMISGIGIYYPTGEETQRIGIVPDLEVKPTIEGIRMGKDELIEKAIEVISKE